jgi:hypothetical protein
MLNIFALIVSAGIIFHAISLRMTEGSAGMWALAMIPALFLVGFNVFRSK